MSENMENVTVNNTEKANETKVDKFVRLGEYRMNKVIDAIGRLEHQGCWITGKQFAHRCLFF